MIVQTFFDNALLSEAAYADFWDDSLSSNRRWLNIIR